MVITEEGTDVTRIDSDHVAGAGLLAANLAGLLLVVWLLLTA